MRVLEAKVESCKAEGLGKSSPLLYWPLPHVTMDILTHHVF